MSTSSYIIELFKWSPGNQRYEKKDDCTLSLDSDSGEMDIKSSADSTVYLRVNIKTESVTILSRQKAKVASMYNRDFTIDYEMFYDSKKFGFRFDSRSASSEQNFYDTFSKTKAKVRFTDYYPSGNKKIEGTKTDDGYNGFCIEYYDAKGSPIKYIGEFEDDLYDGEGEFFSHDGNIRLICRNICSGKPNGKGKLIVGRNRNEYMIEMKDCEYPSDSDIYTQRAFAHVEPEYADILACIRFESLSLEERTLYLFKELRKLKESGEVKKTPSIFNIF